MLNASIFTFAVLSCEEILRYKENKMQYGGIEQAGITDGPSCLQACKDDPTCTALDFNRLDLKCFFMDKLAKLYDNAAVDHYDFRRTCRRTLNTTALSTMGRLFSSLNITTNVRRVV